VLLFVGRLDPQKGPLQLLEAAAELFTEHSDLQLVMVGDGPLATELRAWTVVRGLESRIHFVGRQADVAGLMRAADVFVLPSLWEGLPNVILEAMAAGMPVVATDVEGVRDLLIEGDSGTIVPRNGEFPLAQAIGHVLGNREQARRMAFQAQALVKERFTWPLVAAEYERLYAELLPPRVDLS
jgi:starch synthase (maltosyl-transferring)